MKKILKIVLIIAILIVVGVFAVVMFQTYKPVMDASKEIEEVDDYQAKRLGTYYLRFDDLKNRE